MKKRPLVLHPFLFAVLPLLILYVHNIATVPAAQLLWPLVLVTVLALVLVYVLAKTVKSTVVAALIASPLLLLLLSYGRFYEFAANRLAYIHGNGYLIIAASAALVVAFAAYCLLLLRRRESAYLGEANTLFNLVAAVLVAFNLAQAVLYRKHLPAASPEQARRLPAGAHMPDIYFIILDQYASTAEMKTVFGDDNGAFVRHLASRGFYLAGRSTSKYDNTSQSLATTLNMGSPAWDSPDPVSADMQLGGFLRLEHSRKNMTAYRVTRANRVARLLKSFGYRYLHFGSWYYDTEFNWEADRNFNCFGISRGNEFGSLLARSSVLRLAYLAPGTYRASLLRQFEALEKVPAEAGPKFVFAHIICPHGPYVFGPGGEKRGFAESTDGTNRELYRDQYVFVTKKAEELVDRILERSKEPPVIILESDHGGKMLPGFNTRIFNALYLPNGGSAGLKDDIAPDDVFRYLFSYYFSYTVPAGDRGAGAR